MEIRDLLESDYLQVVDLNNKNTPAVSELTLKSLEELHQMCSRAWALEDSGQLAGFCLILSPGRSYKSMNYAWVGEHYTDFEYLDRIVISEAFRGQGCGRFIYESWFEQSKSKDLLIEVNIKPMNKDSILFHERMGFKAVGEQDTCGGEKRVQYMLFNNR